VAAVFLAAEAQRREEPELSEGFRSRARVMGVVTGIVALGGIFVLRSDASALADELLTGRALPLVVLSAVAGLSCMALLWVRRFAWARIAAATAVAAIVWGWGAGQYPYLLEGTLTVQQGAAVDATLVATLVGLGVGALVLIPSFILLYTLNLRDALEEESALEESAGLHRT
jgi:cytochrome d ubiquinol oxidase subunit II